MSIGDFPESLTHAMLEGVMLVGGLGFIGEKAFDMSNEPGSRQQKLPPFSQNTRPESRVIIIIIIIFIVIISTKYYH